MALTVNELHELLRKSQSEKDKFFNKMVEARARLFDLMNPEQYDTPNAELKSLIMNLEERINEIVEQRNFLKLENGKLKDQVKAYKTLLGENK